MAHFNLKSIFASSNKFTILQLLKELCETIDRQEFTQLYMHEVTMLGDHDVTYTLRFVRNTDTSLVGTSGTNLLKLLDGMPSSLKVSNSFIPIIDFADAGGTPILYTNDGGISFSGEILTDTVTQL